MVQDEYQTLFLPCQVGNIRPVVLCVFRLRMLVLDRVAIFLVLKQPQTHRNGFSVENHR